MYFLSRWDTRRDLNEFTLERMGDEFDVATKVGRNLMSSKSLPGGRGDRRYSWLAQ